jgi:hypothetical protein
LALVEFKEVPLSGSLDQAFTPRAKDIAAQKINLSVQLVNGLIVFCDGLVVELRRLIQRGSKVFHLLAEPVQQLVALVRIGRP